MDPPGGPAEFTDVLRTDRFHNDAPYPTDVERQHLSFLLHFDYSSLKLSNLLVGWIMDLNTSVTNQTSHSNRIFRGLLYFQLQRFKNFLKLVVPFYTRNTIVKQIFAEIDELKAALLQENIGVMEDELELSKVDFDDLIQALHKMKVSDDEIEDLTHRFTTMHITTDLETLYKVLLKLKNNSPIFMVVSYLDGLDDQNIKDSYTVDFLGYIEFGGNRRRASDHVMNVTYNKSSRMVEIVEAQSKHAVYNNGIIYEAQCNTDNASLLYDTIFTAYTTISTKRGFKIYSHPFAELDKSMDPWAAIHKLTCILERSLSELSHQ